MFYCDACRQEHGYPETFMRSRGKCEVCDNICLCYEGKPNPQVKSLDEYRDVLQSTDLAEIQSVAQRLCSRAGIPFDPFKVGVCTDYGTGVVVYLKDN